MVVDTVREMIRTGESAQDADYRLLAQTCVDALSARSNRRTPWNRVVAENNVESPNRPNARNDAI